MLKTSLKQIFRRPVSVAVFLLLMAITVAFLSIGIYLFMSTQNNLTEIESNFRTIGTIGQKSTGASKEFAMSETPLNVAYVPVMEYGDAIPIEAFNFEDLEYIYPPENRAQYFATAPEYLKGAWLVHHDTEIDVIEYRVVEIYPDVRPVRGEVTKVIGGGTYDVGDEVWICDHTLEFPLNLELGQTYASGVGNDGADIFVDDYHGIAKYTVLRPIFPMTFFYSEQIDKSGKRLDDPIYKESEYKAFEVTEGLYESDIGKRLITYAKHWGEFYTHAAIISTNSLPLITAFRNDETYIEEGREITQEEFDDGAPVCMVAAEQARVNNLSVGDKVNFSFREAHYGGDVGSNNNGISYYFAAEIINASGELYEPFYTDEYEVVGIYDKYSNARNSFNLPYATVIVPSASIKGSDENNMVGNLILQPYNVSFEIPNGTSGLFMEKLEENGLSDLVDVTFYDGGYENIKAGLNDMFVMSVTLMAVGAVTTLAVILFFCFLFIGKQRKRIAIERSMGVPKLKSAVSLILGVLLVVMLGTGLGGFAGFASGGFVTQSVEAFAQQEEASTKFSSWVIEGDNTEEYELSNGEAVDNSLLITSLAAVIFAALIIAGIFVSVNLRKEPMELLSERRK